MAKLRVQRNKVFKAIAKSKERHKLVFGGAGSGKSYDVAFHFICRCLEERDHVILVVRKVAATLRGSVFYRIRDVAIAAGLEKKMRSTVNPLEIRFPKYNSMFIFVGIDDPEKLKSINRVTSVWIEEGTELTPYDYQEINRRMRGQDMPGILEIITTFNPISTYHWIYKRWFVDNHPGLKLKSTYKDNRFIDEAYKQELEADAEINPAAYEVYTKGNWGTPEGRIYAPFAEADPPSKATIKVTFYAIDFGFSQSYTGVLRFQVARDIIYVRELIYEKGLTTKQLAERLHELEVNGQDDVYCDPSEAQQIEELYQAGFNTKKAHNDVLDGINCVTENHHRIRTYGGNSNFNKEVALYCYMRDKNGEWLNKPLKANDHLMDALRYGLFSYTHEYAGVNFETM